jgi:hypothetical protein
MRKIVILQLCRIIFGLKRLSPQQKTSARYISSEEAEHLIKEANTLFHHAHFDEEQCSVLLEELSFYRDAKRVEIFLPYTFPSITYEFILTPDGLKKLDGTREAFHEINRNADLELNDNTIVPYVKFVLSRINGEEDSFKLIETWRDVVFTDDITVFTILFLRLRLFKVTYIIIKNEYFITAPILYDNHLYKAEIKVTEDGEIDITGEKLLIKDIPTLDIYLE